jgi:hypothetical protein
MPGTASFPLLFPEKQVFPRHRRAWKTDCHPCTGKNVLIFSVSEANFLLTPDGLNEYSLRLFVIKHLQRNERE